MHSSSGKATSIAELMRAYPSEILWWMIAWRDPISIVPFNPVTSLIDEARGLRDALRKNNAHTEAAVTVERAVGIRPSLSAYPLDHLIVVAQLGRFESFEILRILRRSRVYRDTTVMVAQEDLQLLETWINLYGESYRIRIRQIGESVVGIPGEPRGAVTAVRMRLRDIEWTAEMIHNAIHEVAVMSEVKAGTLFQAIYHRVIGRDRGPKIGWLLETLGREETIRLLE